MSFDHLQRPGRLLALVAPEGFLQVLFPLTREPMAVGVRGHADAVVAQLFLDVGRALVVHEQERGIGMPKTVRAPSP